MHIVARAEAPIMGALCAVVWGVRVAGGCAGSQPLGRCRELGLGMTGTRGAGVGHAGGVP